MIIDYFLVNFVNLRIQNVSNDQTLSLTCSQSNNERSIHECDIDYESSTNSTL